MKKLSINQFDCEREYKQAKKRLKKSSLDQRTARTKRSLHVSGTNAQHVSVTNVPEDLEVMFYEGVGYNNPAACSYTEQLQL